MSQLQTAIRLHRGRQHDQAEAPNLTGVLEQQQGNPRAAIDLIQRAIARANEQVYHSNLAEAFRTVGDSRSLRASLTGTRCPASAECFLSRWREIAWLSETGGYGDRHRILRC